MTPTTLTLTTKPIPINQKYGVVNGRNILSKKYRESKDALQWEAKGQWQGDPIDRKVAMNLLLYFGDKRQRDIDAYIKIILDALEGVCYTNDNQIYELHVFKQIDKANPRTVVQII